MIFLTCMVLWLGDPTSVHNEMAPKATPLKIRLVEQWRVNPDLMEEDALIWAGPNVCLDVDARGHVFILDDAENRIVELDETGKLVKVHGGNGKGPGEFSALSSMQIFPDGLVAFERQDGAAVFNYFDAQYQFKTRKALPFSGVILNAKLSPNQQLLSCDVMYVSPEGKRTKKFQILDAAYLPILEILEVESPSLNRNELFNARYWSQFLADLFKPFAKGQTGFAVFDRNNRIYTALRHTYEIIRWSPAGEKELVFDKEYTPIRLSEKEVVAITAPLHEKLLSQLPPEIQQIITETVVQRAVEMAEFPPFKNPIFSLSITDLGHLWVLHDFDFETGAGLVDIFDADGHFLGTLRHPNFGLFSGFVNRMVVKKDHAYTIETLDGTNHAVCYKIEKDP